MRAEVWKPLPTINPILEGLYKVSSYGRIKSLPRQVKRIAYNGVVYYSTLGGNILSQRRLGKQKLMFTDLTCTIEGVKYRESVYPSKAVGEMFVKNPNPALYDKLTHRDPADWRNNHYTNIMWTNQSLLSTRNMELNPHNRDNLKRANIKSGYYKNINKFRKDRK